MSSAHFGGGGGGGGVVHAPPPPPVIGAAPLSTFLPSLAQSARDNARSKTMDAKNAMKDYKKSPRTGEQVAHMSELDPAPTAIHVPTGKGTLTRKLAELSLVFCAILVTFRLSYTYDPSLIRFDAVVESAAAAFVSLATAYTAVAAADIANFNSRTRDGSPGAPKSSAPSFIAQAGAITVVKAYARAANIVENYDSINSFTSDQLSNLFESLIKSPDALRLAACSLDPDQREIVFSTADQIVATPQVNFFLGKAIIPPDLLIKLNGAGLTLAGDLNGFFTYQFYSAYEKGYLFSPTPGNTLSDQLCRLNGLYPDGITPLVSGGIADTPMDPTAHVPYLIFAVDFWNRGEIAMALWLFGLAFPYLGNVVNFSLFVNGKAWASIVLDGVKICLVLVLKCVTSGRLVAAKMNGGGNTLDDGTVTSKRFSYLRVGCFAGHIGNCHFGGVGGVFSLFKSGLAYRRRAGNPIDNTALLTDVEEICGVVRDGRRAVRMGEHIDAILG